MSNVWSSRLSIYLIGLLVRQKKKKKKKKKAICVWQK